MPPILEARPGRLFLGRHRGDNTETSQPAATSPATANEDGNTTLTLERLNTDERDLVVSEAVGDE